MNKCDVIIPVYNAPQYVDICLFALLNNTNLDDIGTIFLMNDNSNNITRNLLVNLQKKYKDKKVKVINNEENLGFIKNVNKGFSMCSSDYVMLLNTDCFVARNTVGKLMEHMKKDKKIGLICPICSNAANLTLPIFEGFSYTMMDKLLESKFKGMNFDACTVVGNCLMISKECIEKVGYLDEIYGMGYGDETDYQFKAMAKGFKAKVAIDTYVFHKAEVSFNTTNKKRSERLEKNRKIFFDRWGEEYYKLLNEYSKNDPIVYINNNITLEDKKPNLDYAFVMQQLGKGSGGVMYVANLINYLSILGINIGIINFFPGNYDGIMIFNPISTNTLDNVNVKFLMPTLYDSVWLAKKIAEEKKAKVIYFAQGYEFYFLDGSKYGEVEATYKVVDYVLTISSYLASNHKKLFNIDSLVVPNGIDYNILYNKEEKKQDKMTILMNIRQESLKAGYLLMDTVKKLTVTCNNIKIVIVDNTKDTKFFVNNNETIDIKYIKGPVDRDTMWKELLEANILVDSSLSEGFGLLPLEAMAAGVVPVISNALGNTMYCNNDNSVLINKVNDTDEYVKEIIKLLNDKKLFKKYSNEAKKTAFKYAFDDVIFDFYNKLEMIKNKQVEEIKYSLTKKDKESINSYLLSNEDYQKILNYSRKQFNRYITNKTPNNRLHNFKVITKEFLKSTAFFGKLIIKTIKNKNYRI